MACVKLGQPLRLVRFDPDQKRLSSRRWTGEVEAENAFSDGYPLLVASTASLDELNRRLGLAGQAPVTMARFRPNLVLDGLDAHGEDHLDEVVFAAPEGPVRIKLVKPCSRCSIPDVHPDTAATGEAVGQALRAYRADARVGGAITFGMNTIVRAGAETELFEGQAGRSAWTGWS